MCNACGFYCCALDTFERCGCDHCPNSACWSDEDDEEYDDPADYFVCDCPEPVTPKRTDR